jgi:hypothetical protein
MAELAARLGSPVLHDRAGKVVFIETFEQGLGSWRGTYYGDNGSILISSEQCNSGGVACKLTAGSSGDRAAKIVRRWPHPTITKYGVMLIWFTGDYVKYFDVVLGGQDGVNEHQFYLRYDDVLHEIQVKDGEDAFTTAISDIDLRAGSQPPIALKLVVDLTTDKYVRLLINQESFPLDTYSAYVLANPDYKSVRVDVKLWGLEGPNATSWVDDVVLTQSEP